MTETKTAERAEAEVILEEPTARGEIALRDATDSMGLAEATFPPERREQIAAFLNIEAENPALLPYLGICAHYGLDPVMGQIWLIEKKIKVRDGDSKKDKYVLTPTVGRDGLLAIAKRQPDYLGMDSEVVCERDSFDVEYTGSVDDPVVLHRLASKPTTFAEDEDPRKYRGRILGAWAKVYVRGMRPTYFYADIAEYGQMGTNSGTGEKYWMGAWSYTQAMLLKAAQSYALRIAIGVTGIRPHDELAGAAAALEEGPAVAPDPEEGVQEFLEGLDGQIPRELIDELATAIGDRNEQEAFSWSVAKVKMRLEGRDEAAAREVLAEINREIDIHRRNSVLAAGRAEGGEPVAAKTLEPGAQLWVEGDWLTVEDVNAMKNVVKLLLRDRSIEDPPEIKMDLPPTETVIARTAPAA